MKDAVTLKDATDRRFYFACSTCSRRGRYGKTSLILQFGPDLPLPGLARAVAEWRGCKHTSTLPMQAGLACGAHIDIAMMYLELKREQEEWKHRRG